MQSRTVIIVALRGDGVILKVLDLLEPRDSIIAPKGTIRNDYYMNKMCNIANASYSEEIAQK